MKSIFLFVRHRIKGINWGSPFPFLPILRQLPIKGPQSSVFFEVVSRIIKHFNFFSTSIIIVAGCVDILGAKNFDFLNTGEVYLLKLKDFILDGRLDVSLIRAKT